MKTRTIICNFGICCFIKNESITLNEKFVKGKFSFFDGLFSEEHSLIWKNVGILAIGTTSLWPAGSLAPAQIPSATPQTPPSTSISRYLKERNAERVRTVLTFCISILVRVIDSSVLGGLSATEPCPEQFSRCPLSRLYRGIYDWMIFDVLGCF